MEAVLNLHHHGLALGGQPAGGGAAADELAHAGALVDDNPRGAGHAVAAGPAEVADELFPVLLDDGLQLPVHGGGIVDVGDEFVQLALPLHAPDGQGVVELRLPGVGRGGVGDEPAGEALHGDKAHMALLAQVHQGDVPVRGQVAEGELQGVVQAGGSGLLRHAQPVVGDADMPDYDTFLSRYSEYFKFDEQGNFYYATGRPDEQLIGGKMPFNAPSYNLFDVSPRCFTVNESTSGGTGLSIGVLYFYSVSTDDTTYGVNVAYFDVKKTSEGYRFITNEN